MLQKILYLYNKNYNPNNPTKHCNLIQFKHLNVYIGYNVTYHSYLYIHSTVTMPQSPLTYNERV